MNCETISNIYLSNIYFYAFFIFNKVFLYIPKVFINLENSIKSYFWIYNERGYETGSVFDSLESYH